ncbi:MAG: hypothetical protein PV340_04450 [Wolbachia sp.]|nr:hypothetical protein [Wolbachia sp.]MDD9335934.1 hypothetical protein [Wolbachia sp.]
MIFYKDGRRLSVYELLIIDTGGNMIARFDPTTNHVRYNIAVDHTVNPPREVLLSNEMNCYGDIKDFYKTW